MTGSAWTIREMRVRYKVKGVTYELLTDKAFIEAAIHVIPELEWFHREFMAAGEVPESSPH